MRIKKIEIANILSFGHKQVLDNITQFNLFIGKNGSGKTNTLKIIGNLSINFDLIEGNISVSTGEVSRMTPVWTAKIPNKNQNENIIQGNHGNFGDLTIEFDNAWMIHGTTVDKEIIFKNSNHVQGDYTQLKHRITYIDKPISDSKYYEVFLESFNNADSMRNLALLNFGMKYIFDDRLLIGENSHLSAFYTNDGMAKRPNVGISAFFEPVKWSSGTLHIAKIIQQVILSQKILLIDEIEQHLEPRICRKLIQYIFWLCSYGEKKQSIDNNTLNSITDRWDDWNPNNLGFKEFNKEKTCASFEEHGITATQLFISTHSSILIQEFLSMELSASIYEFDLKWMDNSFNPNLPFSGGRYSEKEKLDGLASRKTLFTNVRYINSSANNILDNLGAKGSDLLQTNGVIWVEGPSDVIYIKKWLEMYAIENNKPLFTQGRDYEFQMFGGTLLDSLCMVHEGENEEESYKKLVSMFSFSRNAFVVIDSDAEKKADGTIIDASKFIAAKQYIKNQFETLSERNANLGLWYKDGNTEIRTIESYLDDKSNKFIEEELSSMIRMRKKLTAQKVTESWRYTKKLEEFPNDLKNEIEILYNSMIKWNT